MTRRTPSRVKAERKPSMKMWEIENSDEAGVGTVYVMARTRNEAIAEHIKREGPDMDIEEVSSCIYASLACVDGECGETLYFKRPPSTELEFLLSEARATISGLREIEGKLNARVGLSLIHI